MPINFSPFRRPQRALLRLCAKQEVSSKTMTVHRSVTLAVAAFGKYAVLNTNYVASPSRGINSYVILACSIHSANQYLVLSAESCEYREHIRRVWKAKQPAEITSFRMTRSRLPLYKKRISPVYFPPVRNKKFIAQRINDTQRLLREADATRRLCEPECAL